MRPRETDRARGGVLVTLFVGASLHASLLVHCAAPTAVRVEVFGDTPCGAGSPAVIVVAESTEQLGVKSPSAASATCAPAGGSASLGDVVLSPSGANDGPLALSVARRIDGASADDCARSNASPEARAGCVVAYRQLRFVPHETLRVRIDLRLRCQGIVCPAGQTCVRGACISARQSGCTSCNEDQLGDPDAVDPTFGAAAEVARGQPGCRDIVSDATHVYWITEDPTHNGKVVRIPHGGGGPVTDVTPTLSRPGGLALDTTHVFWGADTGGGGTSIGAVQKGGGKPVYYYQDGSLNEVIVMLAAAPGTLAWTAVNSVVWRGNTDGTTRWKVAAQQLGAGPVAVVGPTVYWATATAVLRSAGSLDAGAPEVVTAGVSGIAAFVVDAPAVFIASDDGTISAVVGTPTRHVLARGQPAPRGLAMDATHLYWPNAGDGTIASVGKVGGEVRILAKVGEPHGITVTPEGLYFCDRASDTVQRVPRL